MTQPAAPAPAAPPRAIPAANYISEDVEIKGTLTFQKHLVSHGRIHGEIVSTGELTIGKEGTVEGNIQAAAVAVHGVVKGNIKVKDRCELRGDAELMGDLDAPRLVIEEGVTFVGNVRVLPQGHDAKRPQPPAK